MASTNFQDYNQNTPIAASWLNDVNKTVYGPAGGPRLAIGVAAALVRFSVSAGVVTIQQALNVQSVVRTGPGVFTVTYTAPLTNSANCYQITQNVPGFTSYSAETVQSVTINLTNFADTGTDPGSCCVAVFGAN